MLRAGFSLILLGMIMGAVPPATAQRARTEPKSEGPTFLDPKEAGPDFVIQGEYATEATAAHKLGVQIAALGDGKFQVVVLPGGLPGDGWDGKGRVELNAARDGATAKIPAANGYEGSIADGSLSLKGADGTVSLKKVERKSPRAGAKPPQGATVLFDGSNADAWQGGEIDKRGLLASGSKTKKLYQDFTLHVEYLLPFKPLARDQERGNSGIYMQDRYEVQVLDSFAEAPRFNGCGAIYRQHAPKLNMCYPPLQWQTYDIEFHAAKFDADGKKTKGAVVTVNHNGVIVQDHYEITAKTGAGAKEGPTPGAIQLQGHNNPVFYRKVWVIAK
ncbi:MAG TPA: DUF1080 domain-containing protein [Tepidisphaeraceae bacterium]|jgi:hypothetical protein